MQTRHTTQASGRATGGHRHPRWHAVARVPPAPRSCTRRTAVHVVAFKDAAAMRDWRTQRMVETANVFYSQVLNKGDAKAVELVVDESVVFRDNVWRATPVVGRQALQRHVAQLRHACPDVHYEVEQMGLQDDTHLFVLWTCHETQLESAAPDRPASHHASIFQGVDVLTFSPDRSKVVEVNQFRQPTAEEREEQLKMQHHLGERSPYEIKLARLT